MPLRLALPSNKELFEKSVSFLKLAGIQVSTRSRSLRAKVSGINDAEALIQRSSDIPKNINRGNIDIGIVGLDRFLESTDQSSSTVILTKDLGFGQCKLVVAVPEVWLDVSSVHDLADLAVQFREEGRELRIATKYPRLTSEYLYKNGINYFALVEAAGAMEAAPLMGYADIITDIVETGTTIRENRLKVLEDGVILESQAVLIGNVSNIYSDEDKKNSLQVLLELLEGKLQSDAQLSVSAELGPVQNYGLASDELKSIGAVNPVFISTIGTGSKEKSNLLRLEVNQTHLIEVVRALRLMKAIDITVIPVSFIFSDESSDFKNFLDHAARLGL